MDKNGIPLPFLRLGLDIGINFYHPRQNSQSSQQNSQSSSSTIAGNAPGQSFATGNATPYRYTRSTSTSTAAATSSPFGAAAASSMSSSSANPASTRNNISGRNNAPASNANTNATSQRTNAPHQAASAKPKRRRVRTYGRTFMDPDSGSDDGDDSSDFTRHRSDEEDDLEKRVYEFGLRDDDEVDDYATYYDGDDHYLNKRRF